MIKLINKILDFLVFLTAFILGGLSRYYIDIFHSPYLAKFSIREFTILFFVFYVFNYISLSLAGVYPIVRLRSFASTIRAYFRSSYIALILIMAFAYVIFPLTTSRLLLLSASFYAFLLLLMKESFLRAVLKKLRKSGYNLRNVVLIGHNEYFIRHVTSEISNDNLLGLKVIGVMTLQEDSRKMLASLPNLGDVSHLVRVIDSNVIDCVIFLDKGSDEEAIKELVWKCQQRGLEIWLKFDLADQKIGSIALEHFKGKPFLNLKTGPRNASTLMVKYVSDRLISAVLLLLLLPLFLIVSILIKSTSAGPIFFKQHRAGINGRKFVLFKFRSMVNNAEQLRDSLRKKNEMKGPVFKIREDPRITGLGRILRKTSIDELPQLLNVLRGEMSLVGPRAMFIREAEKVKGWRRRRFSMKPGITCIWQVTGRNKITDFNEWARLDLKYIDEWSLWLDFKILLRTIPAVLRCTGV